MSHALLDSPNSLQTLVYFIVSNVNFHEKLLEIFTQNYPNCETIITDNEGIFISNYSKAVFEKYKFVHVKAPVQHSTELKMNNIIEVLSKYENFLTWIFDFIKNNNSIFKYFYYTMGIILTIFALTLITNSVEDNKLTTMIFAFNIKITLFVFLKILVDALARH